MKGISMCLAIQKMKEEERISTLLKSIKNLMEKAGWSAEQSMDVLEVSESDRIEIWILMG